MVALLQLLYTSFTLYHANGGQINQYGFVAPGLTVLPYAVMSGLNLIASLLAPHYPTLYLVRSKVMDEAERRTGIPFNYVVGKVNDEPDTNDDVMAGWTKIAGSFEDNNKLLLATPSADEDTEIEISDSSSQRIYIPACPRFQRTDDTRTSPLRRFYETPLDGLLFPRYMALIPRSSFSRLLSQLPSSRFTSQDSLLLRVQFASQPTSLIPPWLTSLFPPWFTSHATPRHITPENGLNECENSLVAFIIGAEIFIALALSNFSGQQSTVAQKAWIATWLIVGFISGAMIYDLQNMPNSWGSGTQSSRYWICFCIVGYSAPAIGGLVVVSQMLKAYGICHRFV